MAFGHSSYTELLVTAHKLACRRPNPSSMALKIATEAGAPLQACLIGAISCIGKDTGHAPVERIWNYWARRTLSGILEDIESGRVIPGFGGSFAVDGVDPVLVDIEQCCREFDNDLVRKSSAATRFFFDNGKKLAPNLGFYSVLYANMYGNGWHDALSVFLESRIPIWINMHVTRNYGF